MKANTDNKIRTNAVCSLKSELSDIFGILLVMYDL